MSATNNTKLDAEVGWFFIYYERDAAGKAPDVVVDPMQVLQQRFPDTERRLLYELSEELRSTGPWVPRDVLWADAHPAS